MKTPLGLKFTSTDEWVKVDGKIAIIGVSDYAQGQLSDVVYVEVKVGTGDAVKKNETIATIESVKAAADVNCPISGKVVAINDDLPQTPEKVNSSPYDEAWMIKIELSNPAELDNLMDTAAYDTYCQGRGH